MASRDFTDAAMAPQVPIATLRSEAAAYRLPLGKDGESPMSSSVQALMDAFDDNVTIQRAEQVAFAALDNVRPAGKNFVTAAGTPVSVSYGGGDAEILSAQPSETTITVLKAGIYIVELRADVSADIERPEPTALVQSTDGAIEYGRTMARYLRETPGGGQGAPNRAAVLRQLGIVTIPADNTEIRVRTATDYIRAVEGANTNLYDVAAGAALRFYRLFATGFVTGRQMHLGTADVGGAGSGIVDGRGPFRVPEGGDATARVINFEAHASKTPTGAEKIPTGADKGKIRLPAGKWILCATLQIRSSIEDSAVTGAFSLFYDGNRRHPGHVFTTRPSGAAEDAIVTVTGGVEADGVKLTWLGLKLNTALAVNEIELVSGHCHIFEQ